MKVITRKRVKATMNCSEAPWILGNSHLRKAMKGKWLALIDLIRNMRTCRNVHAHTGTCPTDECNMAHARETLTYSTLSGAWTIM